jgi:hypothetical protein
MQDELRAAMTASNRRHALALEQAALEDTLNLGTPFYLTRPYDTHTHTYNYTFRRTTGSARVSGRNEALKAKAFTRWANT